MIENLQPKEVFYYFEQITQIPHGSGDEKRISDYLVNFAKENSLEYIQDESLNVIIRKKGTKGYENSPSIIIQGHMDMVCEKNNDKIHDFKKDSLSLIVDGDYIRADRTTLGADDGIAVAFSLALLASKDIAHPPLEAVFTVDEEVGMNGAYALDTSCLKSKMLINIDSEEEGKILVSCAGGMKATIHIPVEFEDTDLNKIAFSIEIKGLKGGHSGSDIDKQRANSNKLMGRILYRLIKNYDIDLAQINGGAKDNAIPREAFATITLKPENEQSIKEIIQELEKIFINEFKNSDNGLKIEFKKADIPQKVFTATSAKNIINTLILIPNGIQSMSLDIDGLVESSTNIGVVQTLNNEVVLTSAIRSSIGTKKDAIKTELEILANLVNGELTIKGEYPAWEYNPNSNLRKIFINTYKQMYNKDIKVEAIHAGLECGLFAKKMPDVDMISFGPDMENVHTPNERLSISSVARTWEYLKKILSSLH